MILTTTVPGEYAYYPHFVAIQRDQGNCPRFQSSTAAVSGLAPGVAGPRGASPATLACLSQSATTGWHQLECAYVSPTWNFNSTFFFFSLVLPGPHHPARLSRGGPWFRANFIIQVPYFWGCPQQCAHFPVTPSTWLPSSEAADHRWTLNQSRLQQRVVHTALLVTSCVSFDKGLHLLWASVFSSVKRGQFLLFLVIKNIAYRILIRTGTWQVLKISVIIIISIIRKELLPWVQIPQDDLVKNFPNSQLLCFLIPSFYMIILFILLGLMTGLFLLGSEGKERHTH